MGDGGPSKQGFSVRHCTRDTPRLRVLQLQDFVNCSEDLCKKLQKPLQVFGSWRAATQHHAFTKFPSYMACGLKLAH